MTRAACVLAGSRRVVGTARLCGFASATLLCGGTARVCGDSKPCCIVRGGPAGLTLGYLLARPGIGVVVMEKHADFLRDFRGDTVQPSNM